MSNPILSPLSALLLLTAVVWSYMYVLRLVAIIRTGVSLQQIRTPELMASVLPEYTAGPSNNLKNLFEVPVIFYVLCLLIMVTENTDSFLTLLAWTFVALRAVHSFIQCTINIVLLRFLSYFLSTLVLAAMAIRFFLI